MQQNWTSQQHTHDKRCERIVSYSSMRPRMKETYSVKSYLSSQEVDELRFHYYSWCYFVPPCPKVTCWFKSHWCLCMLFVKYCDLLRKLSVYICNDSKCTFSRNHHYENCAIIYLFNIGKSFSFALPLPPPTRNEKTVSWSILATCQKLFLLFVAWQHVWYFPGETVNMCKNSILDGHLTNRFGVISLFAKLCRSILYSK